MLGDLYEKRSDNAEAIKWYSKSLPLIMRADMKAAVEGRIQDLKK
jgi:hypothetical protein